RLIVGAPNQGGSNVGALYFFKMTATDTWTLEKVERGSGAGRLGQSLTMPNTNMYVAGMPSFAGNAGTPALANAGGVMSEYFAD
uniref:hypothetical protein n=1 Tax=Escherichia coli TaxID=562 RepID=UPI0019632C39